MSANTVYYAIGDVHGMADKLAAMHQAIFDDIDQRLVTRAVIVHLGDYIDRGPDSRSVIDQIISLQNATQNDPRYDVVSLLGNHEQMMINALDKSAPGARSLWTDNGGDATARSYRGHTNGRDGMVDRMHVNWLRSLPTLHYDRERKIAFVHAGIDPQNFPNCEPEIHLWTRSARFFDREQWPDREELAGLTVVHGHTPTPDATPEHFPHRINVDTGAVFGGPLTCAVMPPHQDTRFLVT